MSKNPETLEDILDELFYKREIVPPPLGALGSAGRRFKRTMRARIEMAMAQEGWYQAVPFGEVKK